MNKINFIVVNGNIFGTVRPESPKVVNILATKIGAATSSVNGTYPLSVDGRNQRPATLADFESFRVLPKGYDTDPRYDFPTN